MKTPLLVAALLGLLVACQNPPHRAADQPEATVGEPVTVTLAAGGVT